MTNQTYENKNIKVTCSREPRCKVHLDVLALPQATQASRQKAIKNVNKEVSIPGFRKGKAPEAMVVKNFSKHIENEWKDILLNTAFDEAIRLVNLFPFNKSSILKASVKNISAEGATLLFEYETAPDVPTIVPEDLSIPDVKLRQVVQKDIDNAIQDMILQRAEWTEVTDRPAQEGDYVDLDVDALSEPAKNVCTDARFLIEPGHMGNWMRRLVIGMHPGDIAEGMSEKEEGEEEEECKACTQDEPGHSLEHSHFKSTLCRIMLNRILTAKLPELNDELAKALGAKDVQDLKEKVEISLKKRADEEQKNNQRMALEQILLQKYPFDIPGSFIQEQIKQHKKAIIDNLRARGMEEAAIATELRKIEQEASERLVRGFCLHFLIQKIALDNKLKVTQDELAQEWMRQMWYQQSGQNTIDTSKNPEEVRSQLHMELLARKALDFLIDKAKRG